METKKLKIKLQGTRATQTYYDARYCALLCLHYVEKFLAQQGIGRYRKNITLHITPLKEPIPITAGVIIKQPPCTTYTEIYISSISSIQCSPCSIYPRLGDILRDLDSTFYHIEIKPSRK